jgi:hypothetical protein
MHRLSENRTKFFWGYVERRCFDLVKEPNTEKAIFRSSVKIVCIYLITNHLHLE